ncbi:apolipoprotein N-acyltransferase [Leucothrix pacifica]|uniref:Apolipoprotein N-acyltransferase n=1 Tax=Leucothrix pacifica TaxID=1247513 RepID=A0A317C7Y5_9GAMM|nr:apolipoprotein N-acyltransferase [Leucothrix pacifica]PWQ94417.1 apolipoprotein N-acyltransferase [Leucothrix pacifica]
MNSFLQKHVYLCALIAGTGIVFSLSPFDFFPIAYISLAVLFYLLSHCNHRSRAIKLGWTFGVGLFGAGTSWVFQSVYEFAQAPLILAICLTSVFVLLLALQIALFSVVVSIFRNCSTIIKFLIVYPAAWVLIEWVRGWLFTGFPWLYVGYSQIDTWFANFAPVGGVLIVSWVTAIISGSLVVLFATSNANSSPQRNRTIAATTVVVLIATAWSLSMKNWVVPQGEPLKISLIQANIEQDKKWLPENRVPSVERYMAMTRAHWNSDLIVWPETAIPGTFAEFNDLVVTPMRQEALGNQTNLLIGGFSQTTSGQVKNTAMILGNESGEVDSYSKRHLVPLGEYIPLLEYLRWLDKWVKIPFNNLAKGDGDGLLTIGEHQAQVSICYEDAFGEEIIEDLPEADYLVNLTNDGWFSHSLQPYQHMQIARFRALESGRYLLRATNTGVSGIINQYGKVVYTIPAYEQGVVKGTISALSGTTPYVKYGNYLVVISASLLLIFLLMRKSYFQTRHKDFELMS